MDITTILLICSLIASVIAIVFSIIAIVKSNRALERSDDYNIEHTALNIMRNYMKLNGIQQIKNTVRDELARQHVKKDASRDYSLNPQESNAVESMSVEIKESATNKNNDEHETLANGAPLMEPVVHYTGIYKDGAFKHVTTVPDNKTVFTIYADSKDAVEGILNVDQSAFDKIAQTPDYLQNACVYSGNGTRLKIIKTGSVVKENGAWFVKEPIVAEFN